MSELSLRYHCKKCDKYYKSNNSLWNHNKKFHTIGVVESGTSGGTIKKYNCIHCEKTFNDKSNKYKHQKICKNKINEIDELKKEIEILKKDKNQEKNINNGSINNGTINNNTVNNIIINNYDKDNIDYITDKFKHLILNMIPKDQINTIPQLLKKIKFDPEHKENNNFKITSDRSKLCYKYKDNKWEADNKDASLNELLNYGNDIFKQFYDEGKEKLKDELRENYHDFQDEIYESKNKKKKNALREKIIKVIENIAYSYTKNTN